MKVLKKVVSAAVSRQSLVLLASVCFVASIIFSGCPETQQMMTPVVSEPTDTAEAPTEPIIVGDEKEETPATEPEPVETPEEPPATEPEVPLDTTQPDFTGQVLMPTGKDPLRSTTRAVAKATVTIISGVRADEETTTDTNGNYTFLHIAADTLRLRVEKKGFEPKEVIVHRSEPTVLADGTTFVEFYNDDPQQTPGTVLIGHRWPDDVRFILKETTLPPDVLLIRVDFIAERIGGTYGGGVVLVTNGNCLLHTIAHELGHAYQHAVAVDHFGPNSGLGEWNDTPGGKAYAEARQKDWEEVGKISYDEGHHLPLYENMAEMANHFWNAGGRFDNRRCFMIKQNTPHRSKWAEEWLGKK